MALPWDRLRAHDGCPLFLGDGNEPVQSGGEFGRGHVVRVASESDVPPCGVHAIRERLPEAAQIIEVLVGDAPV